MSRQTARTITIRRNLPKRRTSLAKLEAEVKLDHWGAIKHLPSGGVAVLKGDLGFMRVIFDVVVYEPSPSFFRKDGLRRVSTTSVDDDRKYAQALFEELS